MSTSPSPNGSNGRLSNGRFGPNNGGGPGNPHAKRAAELRSVLYATVTDDDLKAVALKLLSMAKDGDIMAIKVLLERTIGKPPQSIELVADEDELPPGVRVLEDSDWYGNAARFAALPVEVRREQARAIIQQLKLEHEFDPRVVTESLRNDPDYLDYVRNKVASIAWD